MSIRAAYIPWAALLIVASVACNSRDSPHATAAATQPTEAGQGGVAGSSGMSGSPGATDTAPTGVGEPVSGSSGAAGELGAAGARAPSAGEESQAPPSSGVQPSASDPRLPPEVAAGGDDWPLPNFDYDNTRNPKTTIDSSNISSLREAWRFGVSGGGAFGYVTSNPLIVGGVIYFQDMMSNVFALDRESGKARWARSFEQITFGPNGVSIGWGKLFATAGDSTIVALDLDDGTDVWKFSPVFTHSEGMDIQPVVYDGQVFAATVPVSTTRGVYEGGSHGVLLAIDAEAGTQRWAFDTVDAEDNSSDPDAVGGGGAWYPPLIDSRRGLTYWGTGNPVPWPGTPDKPNGGSRPGPNHYTSSVVAVGLSDGVIAWHYQDQPHDIFDWDFQITPVMVRSAVAGGADLVIGAGKTGAVAALDAQTGKLVWRVKVGKHMNDELTEYPQQSITIYPGVFGGVMSALAYADGVVYVPSVDLALNYDGNLLVPGVTGGSGTLTAIDVHDGAVLWSAQLASACYGAATIANDLVLTSDEKGRVYAFARASGKEVWHYDAPGGINAPLVVHRDALFISVGIEMGAIIALRLNASGSTAGVAGSAAPQAGSGG